jgi:hypothetical protein
MWNKVALSILSLVVLGSSSLAAADEAATDRRARMRGRELVWQSEKPAVVIAIKPAAPRTLRIAKLGQRHGRGSVRR